jgi:hypothetical protein
MKYSTLEDSEKRAILQDQLSQLERKHFVANTDLMRFKVAMTGAEKQQSMSQMVETLRQIEVSIDVTRAELEKLPEGPETNGSN